MKTLAYALAMTVAATTALPAAAQARLSCDDLKAKVEAKFKDKGVVNYTLEAVDKKDEVKSGKVVGTCDGDTKKMVYQRGAAKAAEAKAEPKKDAPKAEAKPDAKAAAPAAKADAKPAATPVPAPAKPK